MYGSFARVYDAFMDNVPYDDWAQHVRERLLTENIQSGIILDLGCGTGSMTQRLADMGYDMIGVDSSPDMLQTAQEKNRDKGRDILYLLQDIREFELYGTVRAVICCCDVLNYITDEEELLQVFRLVNNYLDPGGLFLFDMKTVHHYRDELGDQTFADSRDDCSYIWENTWYEEEQINEYALSLFLQDEDGRYSRYNEQHWEKPYPADRVIKLIQRSGLIFEGVWNEYTMDNAGENSSRLLFAAREHGKQKAAGKTQPV